MSSSFSGSRDRLATVSGRHSSLTADQTQQRIAGSIGTETEGRDLAEVRRVAEIGARALWALGNPQQLTAETASPAKSRGAIDLVLAIKQCGFQEAIIFLNSGRIEPQTQRETGPSRAESTASQSSENLRPKARYDSNPKRKSAYTGSVMLKIRRYSDGERIGYLQGEF
jgi:hypothetical protein